MIRKKTFYVLMALFLLLRPVYAGAKTLKTPILQLEEPTKLEYYVDDLISLTVQCPDYSSRVEYRVIVYYGTSKEYTNLWNTPETGYYYRDWKPSGSFKFNIHWKASTMEPGIYSVTVLVRRADTKVPYDSFVKTDAFEVKEKIEEEVPVTVKSINNIETVIKKGEKFQLPGEVIALMSDESEKILPVVWEPMDLDTKDTGKYIFYGYVEGYEKRIELTLNILETEINIVGNTNGNIQNSGIAAKQGNWIYYYDNSGLWKVKPDGTVASLIANQTCECLNVAGEWIYYRDPSNGYKIYKIKADGSGKTKLSDDSALSLYVIGEYVYYQKMHTSSSSGRGGYSFNGPIYRIRNDGTGRTLIAYNSREFNVVDEWIYYTNYDDMNRLYRVKMDGTNRSKLSDTYMFYINVSDGWIYFSNFGDGRKLYKMKVDGSALTRLSDDKPTNINVAGEWIYYTKTDDFSSGGIPYRIKKDGTDRARLGDKPVKSINIIDEWLYYQSLSDNYGYYRMKIDGTNMESLK